MCTVTFVPSDGKIYMVSNRDEKKSRKQARIPAAYSSSTGKLIYPKDADAGGTWIAMHENGNAIVLLNGGRVFHVSDPPYRKSRGLVLLDIISDESPASFFLSIDLNKIEPFTIVCFDKGKLWEGIWDGKNKAISRKDETIPHIWSSVTLYDNEIRDKRQGWFREWLNVPGEISLKKVVDFHQFSGEGDCYNDLVMDRDGHFYTVSITGIEIGRSKGEMIYKDLLNDGYFYTEIPFIALQNVRHNYE